MEFALFFLNESENNWVELPNARLFYAPNFLSKDHADQTFHILKKEINWQQEKIRMFGKQVLQPRLQAWHGDKPYTYSGLAMQPLPWTSTLFDLKSRAEAIAKHSFNSVLANLYRNGQDSMGWHQDNEIELGINPVIASITLGESRRFVLRHLITKERYQLELAHGSLFIMAGETQHYWQHSIPKTARHKDERINLTFRYIY
ncbi:alpha-ketoglutarate-dependent dioxygenase AlkB family protein [Vibrio ziniensis]|uniref:Alpha-ketoglutarate-dependent dioxygenase AlkB n=1 Tax=Vibrio ziniensis TaxID=2711221 RepID=A0A6G7CP27_9VIBR|nr:alpha-ketoglutarate-dependent dioxygenase AlkB [Vibrio ziniensis]QIH43852.1 alpha-ketoglutarate-dependent dioxygenase AlkB [Vibrio ziniensis]